MVRTLLSLVIVTAQLIVTDAVYCRPPDEVVNSPIPPIKAPSQKMPAKVAPRTSNLPLNPGPADLGVNLGSLKLGSQKLGSQGAKANSLPAATIPSNQSTGGVQSNSIRSQTVESRNDLASPLPNQASATQYYDSASSPEELWDSQPMRAAREGVLDFSRRSAQTSPAEGEQFLSRLSKTSLKEMASWLERYQARQADLSLARDVEKMARQLMLEQAISRQEAMRRAYENVSRLRDEIAAAQEQEALEQAQTVPSVRDRRSEQLRILGLGPIYNPLEPVLDPMSPRGYRRRVGAAMSLPGDLPRGDPGNFIRGDAGIDMGEWTNSGSAEPAAPGVSAAPAPAAPAPPAPAPPAPAGN